MHLTHPPAFQAKTKSRLFELAGRLRPAEKLILGFLAYAAVKGAFFPLSTRQCLTIMGLNLLTGTVVLALSRPSGEKRTEFFAAVRDWLPCVLILVAYRESGLFVIPDPTHRLDFLFVRWDKVLLENAWVERLLAECSPWLQDYLEICYLLCYPLVPLGLTSLYLARRSGVLGGAETERAVNRFWTAVLLALLSCYAIFPLFPLTPPRDFFHDVPGPRVQPVFRKMNFWLLGQYSVNACIFPSGHVAGVTAAGLSVWDYLPRVGVFFLIAAVSVAAATVYGRYHYAADALAGAVVGLAAHFVSKRIHRGSA